MRKKLIFFISLLTITFCFVPFTQAFAAPNLEVKAKAGLGNKGKLGAGIPITITIKNDGSPFSGDLIVENNESYRIGSGLAFPIEIGENETKTIDVFLENYFDDYNYYGSQPYQMFHFYEGGWEKGKSIAFKGDMNIHPQLMSQDSLLFLTLSPDGDRMQGLSKMRMDMQSFEFINVGQIKDFKFPVNDIGWSMGNYLIIDEYILSDLSNEQQQAIISWVEKGGQVVIGASDDVEAEVGILKDYLPLSLQSENFTVSAEALSKLSNGGIFTQPLDAAKSTLTTGSTPTLKFGDDILAAKKEVGKGSVIQTTFSLGDKPFIEQDGFSNLVIEALNINFASSMMGVNYMGNPKDLLSNELGSTNELFPAFEVNTTIIIVVISLYILVVGPLLYFILKRKDKREHAWWIIPVISIVTSAGIFAYGAKDRLIRPQLQQSSFYKVNEDGSLSGYYVESLLTNRSGEFEFDAQKGTTMSFSKMDGLQSNNGTLHKDAMIENNANGSKLTIRNSKYWSVSSVVGESFIQNAGKLDIDLVVSDEKVIGTIKNNFPFTLKEVSIWSGTRLIELGHLKPGEVMQVSENIKGPMLFSSANMIGGINIPKKAEEILSMRKDAAINLSSTLIQMDQLPSIVAWTEDAIVPIELASSKADMSSMNVIVQTFNPKTEISGEFVLPANSMIYDLNPHGKYMNFQKQSEYGYEWTMDDGDYDYVWTIPTPFLEKKISWRELQLATTDTYSLTIEIYNVAKDQYEEVSSGRLIIDQNVDQYITKEGQVKFLLHKKAGQMDKLTLVPELRLKGEVQK